MGFSLFSVNNPFMVGVGALDDPFDDPFLVSLRLDFFRAFCKKRAKNFSARCALFFFDTEK